MANEARVTASLQIQKGNLKYQSNPTAFSANVNTVTPNGPTPGAVTVGLNHTDINFSQLTAMGGLVRIMNIDSTNIVTWGIRDPDTTDFFPVGEMLPGESYVFRLSRFLQKELVPGTGTGPASGASNFSMKASVAPVIVVVEAFDP